MKLEHYLNQLERRLWLMPRAERQAEIQEIREHILALTAANCAKGMDEVTAIQAALEQFGCANKLGRSLQRVWFVHSQFRQQLQQILLIYGCSVLIIFSFLALTMNTAHDIVPHLSQQIWTAVLIPFPATVLRVWLMVYRQKKV